MGNISLQASPLTYYVYQNAVHTQTKRERGNENQHTKTFQIHAFDMFCIYQGTLAECMYINTKKKKTLEITTIKGPLHINYSIRFEQWTGVCSGRVLLFRNKLSSKWHIKKLIHHGIIPGKNTYVSRIFYSRRGDTTSY